MPVYVDGEGGKRGADGNVHNGLGSLPAHFMLDVGHKSASES